MTCVENISEVEHDGYMFVVWVPKSSLGTGTFPTLLPKAWRVHHENYNVFQDAGSTQPGGIRPGQSGENQGEGSSKLSTCCK